MKINTVVFIYLVSLFLLAGNTEIKSNTIITVANNSGTNLIDKPISIKRAELGNKINSELFPLVTNESGDTIPSQLVDKDNDGTWDKLFLVADIPSMGKVNLTLTWIEQPILYTVRTSVKFGKRSSKNTPVVSKTSDTLFANQVHKALGYQPYQTDGPMWENDKVGFRHYFDGRNSKDLFGKKASFMSPENVGISSTGGVEDNYHVMADWGRDILAVGNSVGIGGFGLKIGDSIARLGITGNDTLNNIENSVFNILNEGPVLSVLGFRYNNWHAGNRVYNASEKVSIWPGMYAYKNKINISGMKGDETILIGLVNSNTEKPLSVMDAGNYKILFTHDKQTYEKTWYLGLALILPAETYLGFGEAPEEGVFSKTYYAEMKPDETGGTVYYAVGCWELADKGFTDEEYFKDYLKNLAAQLGTEVQITIK